MPVTHQQIAERLGVSRTLVTGALHGTRGAGINLDTQELVLQTAREMGYTPRNRTTRTIGLVVRGNSLGGESLGAFLRGIEAALQQRNYRMAVMTVWNDQLAPLRDLITPKSVDGVIVTESFDNRIIGLLPADVPAVLTYDEDDIPPDYDLVAMDGAATMEKITHLLLEQGHRRIALLTVTTPSTFYKRMEQGVRRTLAEAGMPPESLRVLELNFGSNGNITAKDFPALFIKGMQAAPACTAVIATDLWRAVPAAQALSSAGIRIPHDVSLVSLFESDYFSAMNPPITATTVYSQKMAARAVERLLEQIELPKTPPTHEFIVGELIERGSIAPPSS